MAHKWGVAVWAHIERGRKHPTKETWCIFHDACMGLVQNPNPQYGPDQKIDEATLNMQRIEHQKNLYGNRGHSMHIWAHPVNMHMERDLYNYNINELWIPHFMDLYFIARVGPCGLQAL